MSEPTVCWISRDSLEEPSSWVVLGIAIQQQGRRESTAIHPGMWGCLALLGSQVRIGAQILSVGWHLKKANKQLFLHFWGTLPNSFSISHCLAVRGIWLSCCWLNYRAVLPLSTHCLFHLSWPQHTRPPGYAHLADGKAKIRKSPPIFTVWRQKNPVVNPLAPSSLEPFLPALPAV